AGILPCDVAIELIHAPPSGHGNTFFTPVPFDCLCTLRLTPEPRRDSFIASLKSFACPEKPVPRPLWSFVALPLFGWIKGFFAGMSTVPKPHSLRACSQRHFRPQSAEHERTDTTSQPRLSLLESETLERKDASMPPGSFFSPSPDDAELDLQAAGGFTAVDARGAAYRLQVIHIPVNCINYRKQSLNGLLIKACAWT
uniref:Uncharacterized protein n=1 Tax=Denticeps clupeoides TaxID=299321 RepID=A0AAY4BVT0_9TELE